MASSEYLQNALYQIQEKSPLVRPLDIPDNTCDRQVPSVQPPITSTPPDEQLYTNDSYGRRRPSPQFIRQHFLREGRLREDQALAILRQATDVLSAEANVLKVKSPVTVVGDIHGQYYDLMKVFEVGGDINETNYLFLGDYVDRGCFGIECLLYLYVLKLWYPDRILLMRGNHECRHLTEYFTFKRECLHKYSQTIYDACIESFCALPVAGLLDGKFFCVHGGISPELNTIADIDHLHRFQEPGSSGLLCDLLWADPIPNFGHENEQTAHGPGVPSGTLWERNGVRGCSYFFTYEAVVQFLERNELLGIIRGHEAQDAGYVMFRRTPKKKFPSVITVFSAPNYLDIYHNRAAVLKYANKNITIRQYHARPHPYWLPNFMDAFTWSLPFVGDKIVEMLLAVLRVCSEEELDESSSEEEETARGSGAVVAPSSLASRRDEIRRKILVVGKMQRLFQLMREESENATELSTDGEELGGLNAIGQRVGQDALGVQGNQIRRYIHSFEDARRFDVANERLPEAQPIPTSYPLVPVPSMRTPLQAHFQRAWASGASTPTGSGENEDGDDDGSAGGRGSQPPGAWPGTMEELVKRVLDVDESGGVVGQLAERIASGRKLPGTRKPRPLKRHETA
ncbi:Metallo-dependent phosphatase [Vararia minispora EC-137]|uniref:Metallo-dependent phosphatase n=1 Tax=Vararia minispora EC-137 TaxID=1314806 RepID=A0ACB8QXI3_9AGAM|nr:Metallo-dependent phosphatase [Vararia minispora EC-137]